MKIGTAKTNITPPLTLSHPILGDFTGVSDELYARVLVLSNSKKRIAIVLCDLMGLSYQSVKRIRRHIETRSKLKAKDIMVCCTHTHSGPFTTWWHLVQMEKKFTNYLDVLERKISDAVVIAANNMTSVSVSTGKGKIKNIARNRRVMLKNGQVITVQKGNPASWNLLPDQITEQGLVDEDLSILKFEDSNGVLRALLFNYSCHNSVALSSLNISADFFGHAMNKLEDTYNGEIIALCTNGAFGDIDPTAVIAVNSARDDIQAKEVGEFFCQQLLTESRRVKYTTRKNNTLICSGKIIELPFHKNFIEIMKKSKKLGEVAKEIKRGTAQLEIQIMQIGELILAGIPGEPFTEISLDIKKLVDAPYVSIVGLANGYIGYIPTDKAIQLGGYGAIPDQWTRISKGAETHIKKTIIDLIRNKKHAS